MHKFNAPRETSTEFFNCHLPVIVQHEMNRHLSSDADEGVNKKDKVLMLTVAQMQSAVMIIMIMSAVSLHLHRGWALVRETSGFPRKAPLIGKMFLLCKGSFYCIRVPFIGKSYFYCRRSKGCIRNKRGHLFVIF